MKPTFVAALLIAALAAAAGVGAQQVRQPALAYAVSEIEAVVTVISIDRNARIVVVRGPQGRTLTIAVPPEAQNLDKVRKGAQFQMRYAEAIAVSVSRSGEKPSASGEQTVLLSPKGGTPGGIVVSSVQLSATVQALDRARRTISVKGPAGTERELRVADEVQGLENIRIGDVVTVVYSDALAMDMIPYRTTKPDVPNDR